MMREDPQLVDRALRVHDQRVDELGGRTNLGCSPRTPEALWEHELGALEQCSLCDLSNGGVSGVPVAGEGWRVHRHWPTGALTDSSHGLCARSGKKSRHNLRSGVPAVLPYRKASPEGRKLSKVRVLGSVGKAIASEGGNKSVPCYAEEMTASSSPSLWCRSRVGKRRAHCVRSQVVDSAAWPAWVHLPAATCSRPKKIAI